LTSFIQLDILLYNMDREVRKITVNIPQSLLQRTQKLTGFGVTETILEGLKELEKREQRSALKALKGKVSLHLDLKRQRQ